MNAVVYGYAFSAFVYFYAYASFKKYFYTGAWPDTLQIDIKKADELNYNADE